MNKFWVFIILLSAFYAVFFGDLELMVSEVLNVPQKTIELLMMVGGLMVFWNGMFNIAIQSGLIKRMSKLFLPLTRRLFADLPKDHVVHEYICANLCANILGLGNAATPMGIKALAEMKKLNNDQAIATKSMITLVILNTTSLTLFPATLFSIREVYRAKINIELLPFIIISTFIAVCIALGIDFLFKKIHKGDVNE